MSINTIGALIAHLQTMPQEAAIHCQVVGAQHPGAWTMFWDFIPTDDKTVQLRIHHPQLHQINPEVVIVD